MEPLSSPRESSNPSQTELEELRQRLEEAEEALRAIRSGEVDALVINTDGGERVYTLQDSEHAYRVMVETMSEGAATLLEDGTILYCNARLAEMLGAPLEQILGACFRNFVDPEGQALFSGLLSQAVIGSARAESVLRKRDQPGLPVLLSLRALHLEGQHPAACLVVTDLTEQRASREELEILVAERTAEIEQRNRELEDFASVISHDLQEPLRKVRRFGDLLGNNANGNLTDPEIDYIQRMKEASTRMSVMIDDLLALARITTRAYPHQAVDLNLVIREVCTDLEARLEKTQGRVEFSPMPVIEAEPRQMQQLFQNLIGNALKFYRPGVPPVVKVTSREIPAGPRTHTPQIVIEVHDNGIGFEEAQVDLIFQPFKRLVDAKEYSGTGIGLPICKKIVERHGGSITAKSTPGVGSTFIVTLPVRQV